MRQIIQFFTHFASLVVLVVVVPLFTSVHTVLTFDFVVPVSLCNQVQPHRQHSRRISTTKERRMRQEHRQNQLIDRLNVNIYSLQQSRHYMMDPSNDINEYNSTDCLRPQHDVPQQENERSTLSPTTPTAAEAAAADDDTKINAAIQFASLVGRLKCTPRTGWKIRGIPNYESVADHSWRVAVLSLLLVPSSSSSSSSASLQANDAQHTETSNYVDFGKIIQLALIHDIAECIVGDITPEDVEITKRMKQDMEYNAVTQITKLLHTATSTHPSKEISMNTTTDMQKLNEDEDIHSNILMTLFHEYEERKTIESIIVKDLDMLDMILQAFEYEQQQYDSTTRIDIDLSDFFTGTLPSKFQYPLLQRMATQIHKQRNEFRHNRRTITDFDKIEAQEQPQNEEEEEEEEEGHGGAATTGSTIFPNGSKNVDMINNEQLTASDIQFVTEYYDKQTFVLSKQQQQQQQPNAIIPMKDIMKIVQSLREWDREHNVT